MTFQINGANGFYDNKVQDDSVRYGRNATANFINYLEKPILVENYATPPVLDFFPTEESVENNIEEMTQFAEQNDAYLNSLPPLEFEYRYMPELEAGQVDKKAVLGAAYEEMLVKELPVEEFETRFLVDEDMSAEALDINKDGKIDIAEYATNILATDVLSKGTEDITKIDGTINSTGMNAILAYTKKANAAAATKLYSELYNTHKLGEALSSFIEE